MIQNTYMMKTAAIIEILKTRPMQGSATSVKARCLIPSVWTGQTIQKITLYVEATWL